ncbi:hypothetical protein BH09SUM1_BH09SUM1_13930 [soil metagenome]
MSHSRFLNRRVLLHSLAIMALAVACMAQDAAVATPVVLPHRSWWGAILDNAVGLTIVFVLISALLGALIKSRQRDRVLKSFDEFTATVVLGDNSRHEGIIRVYPNGVELRYLEPHTGPEGHEKISFIVYEGEYPKVSAIVRRVDHLTPEMVKQREKALRHFINPSFVRRTARFLDIQFSILRDAMAQSFSILVGAAGKATKAGTRAGTILQTQDKQISQLGGTVIGVADRTNDPIFESMFGHGCVIEVPEAGGKWREIPGYFRDYTVQWITLLRASWPLLVETKMSANQGSAQLKDYRVTLRRSGGKLFVENNHRRNIELVSPKGQAPTPPPNIPILPGDCLEIPDFAPIDQELLVRLIVMEPADIIVPRATTVLRHRGGKLEVNSAEEFCQREE